MQHAVRSSLITGSGQVRSTPAAAKNGTKILIPLHQRGLVTIK
jgi:hypothetical protein